MDVVDRGTDVLPGATILRRSYGTTLHLRDFRNEMARQSFLWL